MDDKERFKNLFEGLQNLNKQPIKEETESEITVDTDEPSDEVVKPVIDTNLGVEGVDDEPTAPISYLGKYVCECNVCQAAFFIDTEEIAPEEVCPVCGAEASDLSVVGVVAPSDTDIGPNPGPDPRPDTDEDDFEVEDDEKKEDEEEDEDIEESVKKNRKSLRENQLRRKAIGESKRPIARKVDNQFDESAFDKIVTKYLRENYSNVLFFSTKKATQSRKGIKVEGVVRFKGGNKRDISFTTSPVLIKEGINTRGRVSASCSFVTTPNAFVLEYKYRNGKLLPESLSYDYIVTKDNNKNRIHGKATLESVQSTAIAKNVRTKIRAKNESVKLSKKTNK
jgi:hypothetical protein